jgi:hypothetical protein
MCIFSAPVKTVAGTCIIAGKTLSGNARIIYSNKVACDNGNVMVLPVDSDDLKLKKLDKKYEILGQKIADGYRDYYDYLHPKKQMLNFSTNSYDAITERKVEIIRYGPYDVSITKELNRVDWDHYGGLQDENNFYNLMNHRYPNYLFLIAKIRPNSITETNNYMITDLNNQSQPDNKIPICYEFKPRRNKILMPTYHIHDGIPESKPDWDHYILILNGDIDNFDEDQLIVNKKHTEQFFDIASQLFNDIIFNNDPYEQFKYMSLMRVNEFSKMPNLDLECIFDSSRPLNKPVVENNKSDDYMYIKLEKPEILKKSNVPKVNIIVKSNDSFNYYIIFILIIFFFGLWLLIKD